MLREFVPGPLKSGLKHLVRLPDRLLHPWRRRRARERLAEVAPEARSVLFVCYGNICRSPFAARAFEARVTEPLRSRLRVRSTGFYPEEGRSPPREAVRAAAKLDVDVSGHRSRSLISEPAEVGAVGGGRAVVFVMDSGQRSQYPRASDGPTLDVFVLGDFDPAPVQRRAIRDPFGHPPPVFDETFERIKRCVEEAASGWAGEPSRENEPPKTGPA